MTEIFEKLTAVVDWLFAETISPIFRLVGEGLELLILKPLLLLHLPVSLQVAAVGVLTGIVSQIIRKVMRVEGKEAAFQRKFAARRSLQQPIDELEDWKARDMLYRASDRELDEHFNTYLAQRFARYVAVYLLPICLAMFWLETALPPGQLTVGSEGRAYVFVLPDKIFGIEGLSVSLVFLTAYILFHIVFFTVRKGWKSKWNRRLCTQ